MDDGPRITSKGQKVTLTVIALIVIVVTLAILNNARTLVIVIVS